MGANKKINQEDIRQFVGEDLDAKIITEKADLQRMKFAHAVSSLDNPLSIRAKRKDLARLITEQTRRKMEGGKTPEPAKAKTTKTTKTTKTKAVKKSKA